MRYAVPVMDGKVSGHFGHCQQFALIDADETKGVILKKEIVTSPEHEPGVFPTWLAEQGVSVVIASGMGSRAQSLFRENRIKAITGALGDEPEKVVFDYLKGMLATGDNLCDH